MKNLALLLHFGCIHFAPGLSSSGCLNGIQRPLAPIAGAPSSTTASLLIEQTLINCLISSMMFYAKTKFISVI